MQWLIVVAIVAAVIGFVLYRLKRTNVAIPPSAEQGLSEREALRFRLDNGLPIKGDDSPGWREPYRINLLM